MQPHPHASVVRERAGMEATGRHGERARERRYARTATDRTPEYTVPSAGGDGDSRDRKRGDDSRGAAAGTSGPDDADDLSRTPADQSTSTVETLTI